MLLLFCMVNWLFITQIPIVSLNHIIVFETLFNIFFNEIIWFEVRLENLYRLTGKAVMGGEITLHVDRENRTHISEV